MNEKLGEWYRKFFGEGFQAFLNTSMDGLLIIDSQGRLREVNPAYCKLTGYSREELLTMSIPDIQAEEASAETQKHIEEIMASGKARFETAHRRKDGSIVEVEVSATFLKIENERFLLSFIRDLTEAKEAEKELHRNYDTQSIINSLLQLSLEDTPLDELLKRTLDLILSIPWLSFEARGSIFLVEEDSEVLVMKAQRGIGEALKKECARVPFGRCLCGRAALTGEMQFVDCIDNRHEIRYEGIIPHGHYCIPIQLPGRILGVMNIYLREGYRRNQREVEFLIAIANTLAGILIRKQAEEEIGKLNEDLERRVLERTAQLEEANKELEAFSYSVSHDLRTPLIAIEGLSQVLLKKDLERLDPKGQQFLVAIRTGTKRMVQLIDDLLALSRLGHQEVKLSNIDINELLRVVLEELKFIIPEGKLQLSVKTLPPAYADTTMIRQVFVNLLSNAIKFTSHKVTAVIEVAGWTEDDQNIYYVKDNGAGFDMQYADKLFEVFQRFHHSEEFNGTGIGLAIVKRIIKYHGGRVWAEGKINEGATFYFTLPATPYTG
jgi:PAS domain S-box-containing protein